MKLLNKDQMGEMVRYLIIGGFTTVVGLAVYYILTATVLDAQDAIQLQIANVITWGVGVTFAYFANRRFVFHKTGEIYYREMFIFYGGRIGTLLLEVILMHIFVIMCGINDRLSKIVVQFFVVIGNYLISKLLVFRGSDN